jgi:HD-like signal output (HDOD) protein
VTAISPAELEARLAHRLRANQLKIPSYPAIATKLQAMVAAGRSTEQLAQVAANDPPLVAAVLARATSAEHGHGGAITIASAIARVGVDELVAIAVAESVGAIALTPGPLASLRRDTWRRSLISARVGQELASRRRIAPGEAYLAGLLHDFGSIAVLSGVEELSKEATLPTLPEHEWRTLVAKLRLSFGASIASRWKLPDAIASVIACGKSATPLVEHVALVDRVVAQLDAGGLADAGDLLAEERAAIEAALPEIVAQMALYTHTIAPKHSPIAPPPPGTTSWPCELEVVQGNASFSTRTISFDAIEMVGKASLAVSWLVSVTLRCAPDPLQMLVNIKSCEARDDGTFAIVAQPFGLGGVVKQRWQSLLEAARTA